MNQDLNFWLKVKVKLSTVQGLFESTIAVKTEGKLKNLGYFDSQKTQIPDLVS